MLTFYGLIPESSNPMLRLTVCPNIKRFMLIVGDEEGVARLLYLSMRYIVSKFLLCCCLHALWLDYSTTALAQEKTSSGETRTH